MIDKAVAADRKRVLDALRAVYTYQGCLIWMRSPNAALHGRVPNEMVDNGQADEVIAHIAGLAGGSEDSAEWYGEWDGLDVD